MKKAKPALLRDKMPAPASLNRSVAKAKARTTERRHGPPLWLKRDDSGKIILEDGKPVWEWPFADTMGESPDWAWLVLDAFGTRYRSEEHKSELQSLMRISYAVFCLNKKKKK